MNLIFVMIYLAIGLTDCQVQTLPWATVPQVLPPAGPRASWVQSCRTKALDAGPWRGAHICKCRTGNPMGFSYSAAWNAHSRIACWGSWTVWASHHNQRDVHCDKVAQTINRNCCTKFLDVCVIVFCATIKKIGMTKVTSAYSLTVIKSPNKCCFY